jgi:hypothetical protein
MNNHQNATFHQLGDFIKHSHSFAMNKQKSQKSHPHKNDRHDDIAEILLKVTLSTIKPIVLCFT